jgi:hypothetical protein
VGKVPPQEFQGTAKRFWEIKESPHQTEVYVRSGAILLWDTDAEYFPTLLEKTGPTAFAAQCIPARRREAVVHRLNDFLGTGEDKQQHD